MKVKSNPEPLFAQVTDAFYAAGEEAVDWYKANAPRSTGEVRAKKYARQRKKGKRRVPGPYADSLRLKRRMRGSRVTASIFSPLPYAGALERGAWTSPWKGRGPHISRTTAPGRMIEAGPVFEKAFYSKMRTARAAAYMSRERAGSLTLPPSLELAARP